MTRAGYRAMRFAQALLGQPRKEDSRLAAAHLPHRLRPLYEGMSRAEQLHSLSVLRALLHQGHTDPDLLAAGLLHDVGKLRAPLRLLDRVLVVLAQRIVPAAARTWNAGSPRGWRRPFVVAARHAKWGAEILTQAGASPRLIDLVRRHHLPLPPHATEVDRLLAALQAADGGP